MRRLLLLVSVFFATSGVYAASCFPRPSCLDATPRCKVAVPVEGWCPRPTKSQPSCQPVTCTKPPSGCYYEGATICTCGKLICPTVPSIATSPLMCTGASCLKNSQTGHYQCSMQPVSVETTGTQTVQYEGYCTNHQYPSVPITLTPVIPSSPTFQPIYLHPGSYSCMFRYCLTATDGSTDCISWGQGGPFPPVITPVPKTSPDPSTYTCPEKEWINCMPSIGTPNPLCTQSYLSWAMANCPDFRGPAY